MKDELLAKEWIDWVEDVDSKRTREKEIFPVIKSWLKGLRPNVLADLGCGQGSCSELVDNKIKYVGVDYSSILIKRAKKLYLFPNKKFFKGDVYDVPLKNESVDAIMSIWVWSHLDNLELAAKEMYRVLKPQGRFLIITANPKTYDERKTFYKKYVIKDNLLIGTFDLGGGKQLTDATLYLHSKDQIENAIALAGFNINYMKGIGKSEFGRKKLYLVIEGSKK